MPVVDVSGSMTGTPMEVAIALGLIVAYSQENNAQAAYSRQFLTFSSRPQLYTLPPIFATDGVPGCSIGTVAKWLRRKPWGGSTDFDASMRFMLDVLKEKYPRGTMRKQVLMVFTDMQFDCADCRGFLQETNYNSMRHAFHAGRVPMPTVVFWNIRGDVSPANQVLPASSGDHGVVCLSGYNADLLQDFFNMLCSGAFSSAQGTVEEDPCVETGFCNINRLCTDAMFEVVESSCMYKRYVSV